MKKDLLLWMEKTNEKIQENKEYLTTLDQAIGDGDHGINMARGFQEVVNKIFIANYESISDCLKDIAMILLSRVGGASGPLYGTAFLRMSNAIKEKQIVDKDSFTTAIDEAINGMVQRGKAKEGDKTLLDVWLPVLKYLKEKSYIDWNEFEQVAKIAMESTKDLIAIKGRASYLKERSIGHLDPGSVSSYFLFQALSVVAREAEK